MPKRVETDGHRLISSLDFTFGTFEGGYVINVSTNNRFKKFPSTSQY